MPLRFNLSGSTVTALIPIIAASAVFSFAQDKSRSKPDFSGIWVYNESKSNLAEKKIFGSSRSKEDPQLKVTIRFTITRTIDELSLTETRITETIDGDGSVDQRSEQSLPVKTYFLDKRGEENKDESGRLVKSKTGWSGKTIVIASGQSDDNVVSTTLKLSKDGKELRIVILNFRSFDGRLALSGFGDRTFTRDPKQ